MKRIYDGDKVIEAEHINGYLMDGPDVWVESRTKPICDVPVMMSGGKPVEGGNLIFTDEERILFLEKEPLAEKYMRPFMGAEDYLYNNGRWCLWLNGVSPGEMRKLPHVMERVQKVREFRLSSVKEATRKAADTPWRFMEIKQPQEGNYLLVPKVSSERRTYLPVGFMSYETVASDLAFLIPSATLYHFGILTSSVHMAWMRTVCGRLKSDYRYSANIVYNNFPWPEVEESGFNRVEGESVENVLDRINKIDRIGDDENPDNPVNPVKKTLHVSTRSTRLNNSVYSVVKNITQTAQAILDARALYPDSSLADLYDPLTMPIELRKAHAANDAAVMKAYGYAPTMTEPEIVADLMRRYQKICKG